MRKRLPNILKDNIKYRQKNKCVCCIENGSVFHHIDPICFDGQNSINNIVLLCKEHHKKVHLADPETCMQIFEYIYYLYYKVLPDNPYDLKNAEELIDKIRKDYNA